MSATNYSFEDLKCWHACRTLRIFVVEKLVPALDSEERFRFQDQLLRASRSTTANIAEGYGRHHYIDNTAFCENAKSACYAILDHVIAGADEGFFTPEQLEETRTLVDNAVKLTREYTAYLRKAKSSDSHIDELASHYHSFTDTNPGHS